MSHIDQARAFLLDDWRRAIEACARGEDGVVLTPAHRYLKTCKLTALLEDEMLHEGNDSPVQKLLQVACRLWVADALLSAPTHLARIDAGALLNKLRDDHVARHADALAESLREEMGD